MAFFKKRSTNTVSPTTDPASDLASSHVDPERRRARHQLIGATILILVAVLVLPWLFDVAPPQIAPDTIPVVIEGQTPSKTPANTNLALTPASAPTTPSTHTSQIVIPTQAITTGSASASGSTIASPETTRTENMPSAATTPVAATTTHTDTSTQPATSTTAPTKPTQTRPTNLDELIAQRQTQTAARQENTQQTPDSSYNFPEKGRFVVQVGAYADAQKIADVRKKLSQAGLNNYTQRVTVNGQQITRVRIGPFPTRKQMEQAAAKVRALGLPVSMYQL